MTPLVRLLGWLELVLGSALLVFAIWSLAGLWTCPTTAHDCKGWAMLGALVAMAGSAVFCGSGFWLLRSKSWLSQLPLIVGFICFVYWGLAG
ncbi:MAG: hypothetical protein CVV07_06590 [Gammaproteobacteria bacterium HGW-Gammaproteobacteria-11]|nr:MAG: hypothetical protein CVV07_06590 [Gammaproteobacteria bacterium HGW-Gammaproteobacteria-11]